MDETRPGWPSRAWTVARRLLIRLPGMRGRLVARQTMRHAAQALDGIDECVLITALDGRLSFLNAPAQDTFGIRQREACHHTLADLLPDVDPLALTPANPDDDFCLEPMWLTLRGESRCYTLTRRALHPDDGQAAGFLWVLRDVTVEHQAQEALAERERFWAKVLGTVPDTLYVHDLATAQVLFSNQSLAAQLGYDPEQKAPGPNAFWERVTHPDDREYAWRLVNLRRSLPDGRELECLLRWRHSDGQWRWFSISEKVLARDAQGRVAQLVGIARDRTGQIHSSNSLRASERRYRMLAESLSDIIFTTDNELRIDYISPSVERVLGYTQRWAAENGLASIVTNPLQVERFNAIIRAARHAAGDPSRMAELRRRLASETLHFDCQTLHGRPVPVELRIMLIPGEHHRFGGLLCIGRDVSSQRRAEKDLRMAATVFQNSTAAIVITDPAGYIVQVNDAFTRITGYRGDEVIDQTPDMLSADRQQVEQLGFVFGRLQQRGSWEGELWLKRRGGEPYPCWVGITAVRDEEDDLMNYVCFFSDISERKASEQRIHRLAYYDNLTQLPNRTLFQDRLHGSLQQAVRRGEWVAMMFLDLDRFKPINDSLGHAAGDRMLKEVAVRLSGCVEVEDTVARMGGDEFTLLLQPCRDRDSALTRAVHVAERILESLSTPFVLSGREFFVTASIGIALGPQDGAELSQLMKNADTAMYHAKERGKNNFQFYQSDMNASALERLELESDLRHALEQRQFLLHYQPQFSADGQRLTGAEAVLRWQHPTRGLLLPGEFIPVLEEIGLVVEVGDWALGEACRQIGDWQSRGVPVPKVSVNLSARQFSDGLLGQRVAKILEVSGIAPESLELELTESTLMRDVGEAMRILTGLKQLGPSIAVDDFGTGYSSLNYLKQFPIDVLKIDRSFVDGLPEGEQDAQIARAIIAMSHSLGMCVIAEGVEQRAQLDFLRAHGCDEVQGYLLGRPMPADRFEAHVDRHSAVGFADERVDESHSYTP